jgi:hypothetical protein
MDDTQRMVTVTLEQCEEFELAKAQLIRDGANPDAVYDMGLIEVIAAARVERAVKALRLQVEAGRRTVQNLRDTAAIMEHQRNKAQQQLDEIKAAYWTSIETGPENLPRELDHILKKYY